MNFKVAFVVLPGTDDAVVFSAKTLREKLQIDFIRLFEEKTSTAQVDVSLAPSSAEQANSVSASTDSSLWLMSGPIVTLTGMKMAQVEAGLQESPDEFRGTLLSCGPTIFMTIGELMQFLKGVKWMHLSLPTMAEVVVPLHELM